VTAIAAGAGVADALRLGTSMVALQAGIGATNDAVDAPTDRGLKAGKPIPAGLVSGSEARLIAVVAFVLGLVLAAPSGPAVVGLAVIVIGIGLAYDLRLKGTAWSWLPFAVGVPLLPVYGWLGVAGTLARFFGVLVPTAVAAGAALAIANALVDHERDRAAGVASVVTRLGAERAWAVHIGLLALVGGAAILSAWLLGAAGPGLALIAVLAAVPLAAALIGRDGDPDRRERAWELEAVGLGLLATAWLAGPALGAP
jgi:4-hydroxybenzoate polyprenyltransferase